MTDTHRAPTVPRLAWQDRDQPKPRLRMVEPEPAPEPELFRPRSAIREKMFPQAKPIAAAIVRQPKGKLYDYSFGPSRPNRDWIIPADIGPLSEDAAEPWRRNRIVTIVAAVCDHYGVKPADVFSHRRTNAVMIPRQVAMYLARTITLRSLPEIGRRFGRRDHSTVLHSVRKIEAQMGTDPQLCADVASIRHRLMGGK